MYIHRERESCVHLKREPLRPGVCAEAPSSPVERQRDAEGLSERLAQAVQQARGVVEVRGAEDVRRDQRHSVLLKETNLVLSI